MRRHGMVASASEFPYSDLGYQVIFVIEYQIQEVVTPRVFLYQFHAFLVV